MRWLLSFACATALLWGGQHGGIVWWALALVLFVALMLVPKR